MSARARWIDATTSALAGWKKAQLTFWDDLAAAREDESKKEWAHRRIRDARAEYRHMILSWYRGLLLPMKIGDAVPSEVALLIAEEWDEVTA